MMTVLIQADICFVDAAVATDDDYGKIMVAITIALLFSVLFLLLLFINRPQKFQISW